MKKNTSDVMENWDEYFCLWCPIIVINRPFLSFKDPHFQNEAKTFLVKLSCRSFICMKIKDLFHIKSFAFTLTLKQTWGYSEVVHSMSGTLWTCSNTLHKNTSLSLPIWWGAWHDAIDWWLNIKPKFYVLEYITRAYNVNPFLQDPVIVR